MIVDNLKRFVFLLFIMSIIFAQNVSFSNLEQNKSLIGAYLKSSLGYSHGIKSVNSGINEIKTESQTVYIRPGIGIHVSSSVGIFLFKNICLELGAGYNTYYKYFTNGNIRYDKYPINGNVIFFGNLSEQKYIYVGIGAGQYLLPTFSTEVGRHLRVITYPPIQFAKGTIGLRKYSLTNRSFWFGELEYRSCKRPAITSETFNLSTANGEEKFMNPSLNGFTLKIGFGFGI